MTGRAPILGLTGLVLVAFGLIEHWMTFVPGSGWLRFGWFALLHIAAGAVALVWYFTSGSGSLADFVRRRSTRYGTNAAVYTALFVAVVAMANVIAYRYNARFDLSEAKVNSLSEQSREVLASLDGDVEILAFVGPKDTVFVKQVADIYSNESDRVRFRIVDAQIDPELAQRELITQLPSLKIKMDDRSATVNKIDEETITNGIHKVSTTDQKTVYFIEGHGEGAIDDKTGPAGLGLLADALKNQNYVVESLFLAEAERVPDDAGVVIATAAPKAYFETEVAALRSYLAGGGSLLLLLEPGESPELVDFAETLGVDAGNDVILDQQVRLFQGVTLGMEPVISTYGDHPAVEPLESRTVLSVARSVLPASPQPDGIVATVLASTAETSWAESDVARVFDHGEAELGPEDIAGPVPVAVAVEGLVSALGGEDEAAFKAAVFGDKSFLANQRLAQLFNDAMGLAIVGWLAGEEERISIGPRVLRASRIYLGESEARTVFYLSVLVLPELILLIGIAVWWRRSAL